MLQWTAVTETHLMVRRWLFHRCGFVVKVFVLAAIAKNSVLLCFFLMENNEYSIRVRAFKYCTVINYLQVLFVSFILQLLLHTCQFAHFDIDSDWL